MTTKRLKTVPQKLIWYKLSTFRRGFKPRHCTCSLLEKRPHARKQLASSRKSISFCFLIFRLLCLSFKKQAWTVVTADSVHLNCIFALPQKKDAAVFCCLEDYRVGLLPAP